MHRTTRGSGQVTTTGKLLSGGADVNSVNKIGQTPLIYSCIEQHVKVAKLLLKVSCSSGGADVNSANKIGRTSHNNLEILPLVELNIYHRLKLCLIIISKTSGIIFPTLANKS
jgi:ankyrin repeat protein